MSTSSIVLPAYVDEAARRGDAAAIQQWLSSDEYDRDQLSDLLHTASTRSHVDVMRFLLERGADANFYHAGKGTVQRPLHLVSFLSRGFDAAVLLLEHGAEVDARNFYQKMTALMFAAKFGHIRMLRLFLDRGADVDARCDVRWYAEGRTAEEIARHNKQPEAVALLVEARRKRARLRFMTRLLALRVLCDEGRASTEDDLLARVFGAAPHDPQNPKRARLTATTIPRSCRRKIFWLIVKFWRSDRDSRS